MRAVGVALAAAASLAWGPGPAEARLVKLTITTTEPFAGGKGFGEAGAYVRMVGTAAGELDPADPQNAAIAGLDKAPRNARGLVEYETDVFILRPAEPGKGNRTLLYDVTNRGRKFFLHWIHEAPQTSPSAVNDPSAPEHAGNGFALERGYTLVWSGWDPDAPKANSGMTIRVPVATDGGRPIVKTIREEFVFGTRAAQIPAAAALGYEAADLDPGKARLTVRAREADPRREIPHSGWAYAGPRGFKLLPDGTRFEPGAIYEFWYPAKDPKVLGVGLAATRDLVSHLRYGAQDATPGIRHALAVGISQSGRYLRDHLELGMNRDESGRKVFDGLLAHISGVGKVFLNEPFAQPNRTNTQHEDHHFPENRFPFAHAALTDPVTGKRAGLLRGDGSDPFVIETNTSTEYWQKGASLLHTDPLGREDLAAPPAVRLYLIAGTQHGGRAGLKAEPGNCVYPRNPHNPAPALRALLVALHRWVAEGVEPPPSRVPTIAAGTLVPPGRLGFPAIPGVQAPASGNHLVLFGDWVNPEHQVGKAYAPLVPAVGPDGNETAGIRLPPVAAPIATYTGWNFYKAPFPEGELCDRDGTFVPLPRTRAEREAKGDARPSLEERYGNHEGYVKAVAAAAEELEKARLLLPGDARRYVEEARGTRPW